MAIYERLTSDGAVGSPAKLQVHAFCAAHHLYLTGHVNLATFAFRLALDAGDQTEVQAIKATYDALATAAAKAEFAPRVQAVFLLAETGLMSKSEAKTVLGF